MAVALRKFSDEELASAMKLKTALLEIRLAAFDTGELEIRRIVAFKKRAEIT